MTKRYEEINSDRLNFRSIEMESTGRYTSKDICPEMVICASNIIHGLNRIGEKYYTVILWQDIFSHAVSKNTVGKYNLEITRSLW